MSNIIKCSNINYSYSDGNTTTEVLNGLELIVKESQSIAILGQSGCGKSTLLNLLGGMDKPNSGKIEIANIDINTLNEEQLTNHRAQHLGFIYQFHHLLKDFSAVENTALPLLIQGINKQQAHKQALDTLNKVGLENRANHLPGELSGGERQRVAIARAIITNPSCILADEPTGNLDANNAEKIIDLLIDINKSIQTSLVIVTHDKNIAKKMQRVLIMEKGKLSEA